MSPQSLISILAILPISTATSWHLDQRFSPLQNFLKICFWASLHSPLYACLPTKATSTVNVGNTVDAVNADKAINASPLKQQLFEEHLPSLLHRSLKRRKQGVNDQQKVQEEVSLEIYLLRSFIFVIMAIIWMTILLQKLLIVLYWVEQNWKTDFSGFEPPCLDQGWLEDCNRDQVVKDCDD